MTHGWAQLGAASLTLLLLLQVPPETPRRVTAPTSLAPGPAAVESPGRFRKMDHLHVSQTPSDSHEYESLKRAASD